VIFLLPSYSVIGMDLVTESAREDLNEILCVDYVVLMAENMDDLNGKFLKNVRLRVGVRE